MAAAVGRVRQGARPAARRRSRPSDFVTRRCGTSRDASTSSAKPSSAAASLQAVGIGQPVRVVFDAEPRPGSPRSSSMVGEVARRVGIRAVRPDADVRDVGRVPRLPQIGRAGQQRRAAVRADVEALEEAEAERVVAGQPIHALLREQQQAVERALRHGGLQPRHAGVHFGGAKCTGMDRLLRAGRRGLASAGVKRQAPLRDFRHFVALRR